MMKKYIFLLMIVLIGSSCSMNKQSLGLGRNVPDEFMVLNRKPLSFPPDYNTVPPKPGEKEEIIQISSNDEVKDIFLGEEESEAVYFEDDSKEQEVDNDTAFLNQIEADKYDANIRKTLKEEAINDPANNKYLISDLMFWGKKDNSVVLDSQKEADRIKNNKKQGLPIDTGEVQIINLGDQ